MKITICGFGLIGGSLALDFMRRGPSVHITAFDRPKVLATLRQDRRFRVRCQSKLSTAVHGADIVILSAYHKGNESILHRLGRLKSLDNSLIIDTGAVKANIALKATKLSFSGETQFMPSHPMAGRERKGYANAAPGLFKNHAWYLDDSVSLTKKNRIRLEWMLKRTGANPIFVNVDVHDELVSELSHLPQLISSVLAAQVDPAFIGLAGPGLRSMLRLAGSPYSVWSEIIDENRQQIVKSLQLYIDNLSQAARMIRLNKPVKNIFAAANRSYRCL